MVANPSPDPKNNMWDLIAYYLRFLRNLRGVSGEDLGEIMNCGKASVSRIENGQARLDGTQAVLVDSAWNTGDLFSLLVWYASLGHDPQWFPQFLDLERRAGMIRTFEAQVIPGLLQTVDYARAVLIDSPKMEELLQERLARQQVLKKQPPPHLSVLISQNVLDWPIGETPDLMQEQLSRLLEASEDPNIVVRVVPRTREVGAYAGLAGSFHLMSGDDYGEVVYTESPGLGRLVRAPSDVRSYAIRFDRIGAKALPEGPSRDLIREIMEATSG